MSTSFARPTRTTFQNRLLDVMPGEAVDQLWPDLEWMPLAPKAVLMVPDEPVHHVCFIETGTVR